VKRRDPSAVYAFEVWVAGTDWPPQVINARTRGKAKYDYWLRVTDAWSDIPITAMRSRRIGSVRNVGQLFEQVCRIRQMPAGFRCGSRVACGEALGTVVGSDSSANFLVLFDDDAPEMAGVECHMHPSDFRVL
jgi:hypothetical protein